MVEEIFDKLLMKQRINTFPSILLGELSFNETFNKINEEISQRIFILDSSHTKPIKVVFEEPTWQLIEDEKPEILLKKKNPTLERLKILD